MGLATQMPKVQTHRTVIERIKYALPVTIGSAPVCCTSLFDDVLWLALVGALNDPASRVRQTTAVLQA
jgi:hypothetical protein